MSERLEVVLFEWIEEQRSQKLRVILKSIQMKAKLIAKELKIEDFAASSGRLVRLM